MTAAELVCLEPEIGSHGDLTSPLRYSMVLNHVFLYYTDLCVYKVFWSFLYDFDLLNPNPLSASRKSLSNFVQMQKKQNGHKNMRRHSNSHLCARIWSNNCLRNAQPESSLMRIGRSSLWRITTWSWWLSTSDVVPKPICLTCLPVINARAISNEDGASIR